MSAGELRQAAETLRMLAGSAMPGPWEVIGRDLDTPSLVAAFGSPYDGDRVTKLDTATDGAYIATMHPGVGLALAVVLDATAGAVDSLNDAAPRVLSDDTLDMNLPAYIETVTLARAINGGAS